MIRVTVRRDPLGRIAAFEARGHAAYDEEGFDIVCAAVSALLQTALLGLERCALAAPTYRVARGDLRCTLPPESREGDVGRLCAVLLDSMLLGLREIQALHPGYVRIDEKRMRAKKGQTS
ncbi:MAG: ribosomal-processing cysteine protease Prp [Armatimonadetes bacterium]|nr:ribosomal-processing cysteine protease Prp [Armatimonadota bacterium]